MTTTRLSDEHIEQFNKDGFIFPIDAIPTEEALEYRSRLEEAEKLYYQENPDKPISHFLMGGASPSVFPLASELCFHAGIVDAVESLLGPDIMVWGVSFFIKNPGDGKIVSWHQDLTYWGFGETSDQVTAWVALSPVTKENGCMKFVSGSHKNKIVPHKTSQSDANLLSRGQEIAVEVDEKTATHVLLSPGQISLHHGLMFHGSGPNHSSERRIGVAIRYVNPNAQQMDGSKEYALLVRGRDRNQNFIHFAPATRGFHPDEISLHQEILDSKTAANF